MVMMALPRAVLWQNLLRLRRLVPAAG